MLSNQTPIYYNNNFDRNDQNIRRRRVCCSRCSLSRRDRLGNRSARSWKLIRNQRFEFVSRQSWIRWRLVRRVRAWLLWRRQLWRAWRPLRLDGLRPIRGLSQRLLWSRLWWSCLARFSSAHRGGNRSLLFGLLWRQWHGWSLWPNRLIGLWWFRWTSIRMQGRMGSLHQAWLFWMSVRIRCRDLHIARRRHFRLPWTTRRMLVRRV